MVCLGASTRCAEASNDSRAKAKTLWIGCQSTQAILLGSSEAQNFTRQAAGLPQHHGGVWAPWLRLVCVDEPDTAMGDEGFSREFARQLRAQADLLKGPVEADVAVAEDNVRATAQVLMRARL